MSGSLLTVRPDGVDYRKILLSDTPLIDVRAPIEFKQGAFPTSANLPLMLDSEREAVGISYKQEGQEAALALGHQLVYGEVREARMALWREACLKNPNGYIYCFRGGLRSHLVQEWLHAEGLDYPLIEGGYKALRTFLLGVNQQAASEPITLIGGNTGSGKTRLVREIKGGIDLEGAAHHRGSSFGRTLVQQTSQIDFENRLAIILLKKQEEGTHHWVLEDEGRTIGSNHVPLDIYDSMQTAPVAVIDDPFDVRVTRLHEEYVDLMRVEFERCYGKEQGWAAFAEYLRHGMYAIRKRLGMERYQELARVMDDALQTHLSTNKSDKHLDWLIPLLKDYYDPMYTYQLSKKADRIVFRGDYAEVRDYLLSSGE